MELKTKDDERDYYRSICLKPVTQGGMTGFSTNATIDLLDDIRTLIAMGEELKQQLAESQRQALWLAVKLENRTNTGRETWLEWAKGE